MFSPLSCKNCLCNTGSKYLILYHHGQHPSISTSFSECRPPHRHSLVPSQTRLSHILSSSSIPRQSISALPSYPQQMPTKHTLQLPTPIFLPLLRHRPENHRANPIRLRIR